MYIVGEYESANGTKNEIVVWDRIVRRQKDAHIRLQNAKAKYMVRDLKPSLGYVQEYICYPYILAASSVDFATS